MGDTPKFSVHFSLQEHYQVKEGWISENWSLVLSILQAHGRERPQGREAPSWGPGKGPVCLPSPPQELPAGASSFVHLLTLIRPKATLPPTPGRS